jgi:hypothetical protein
MSASAQADVHFVVLSTESTSPRVAARLNLTDIIPTGAAFRVFPADGSLVEDTVPMNPDSFATSASSAEPGIRNLFVGSGGASALVRAEAIDASGRSFVILEQSSSEEKVVLAVPPVSTAAGSSFAVPIGALHRGTTLLVGNPNSTLNGVILRYGQEAEQPPILVNAFGVAVVPITRANTHLRIRVTDASLPAIAQLAVDTGRTTVMTFLLPLAP